MKTQLLVLFLFTLSLLLRLTKIIPNFEFVTTALVISSLYLSRKQSFLLILSIMIVSDIILGNTSIFLFTWSGFLIPILIINKFRKTLINDNNQMATIKGSVLGLSSNLFFFFWTNLGVWLLDSWGMYPNTFPGLVQCYINALPFLKNQLLSTLILLPSTLSILQAFKSLAVFKELRWARHQIGSKSGTVPQL